MSGRPRGATRRPSRPPSGGALRLRACPRGEEDTVYDTTTAPDTADEATEAVQVALDRRDNGGPAGR